VLPLDIRVAISPQDAYSELITRDAIGSWRAVFERVALAAVLTGTLVTMSSARHVPFSLVLMGILCWSFVPFLQLLVGAIVVGAARTRTVSTPRSLELLFMAHLPWSIWLLTVIGLLTFTRVPIALVVLVPSLLIPAVWTWVILAAFCRTVLGCSLRLARQVTFTHQAMTWALFTAYVVMVSGIWARVLAKIGQ
jgi:hypothetical protein